MNHRASILLLTAGLQLLPAGTATARVEEVWRATYTAPGSATDRARHLALAIDGSLFVTGQSFTEGRTYSNTFRYDEGGDVLWSITEPDFASSAIAVDKTLMSYVLGEVVGNEPGVEVVRYGVDGSRLWRKRLVGFVTGAGSIHLDGQMGLFVLTSSTLTHLNPTGSATWSASLPEGQWFRMEQHTAGDIVIMGVGASNVAYLRSWLLAKYTPEGTQVWSTVVESDNIVDELMNGSATDTMGNLYVTGRIRTDFVTTKFDSQGTRLWTAASEGPEMRGGRGLRVAVGLDNHVYVAGSTDGTMNSRSATVIKYSVDGVQEWLSTFQGADRSKSSVADLAASGGGAIVSVVSEDGRAWLWMLEADGRTKWLYSASGRSAHLSGVVSDGVGGIYACGASNDGRSSEDFLVLSIGAEGTPRWVGSFDMPARGTTWPIQLLPDPGEGSIYALHEYTPFRNNYGVVDIGLVKYGADGALLAQLTYDNDERSPDHPVAACLGPDGGVYVGGTSGPKYELREQIALLKYDVGGSLEWSVEYGSSFADYLSDIAVGASGDVYVCGTTSIGRDDQAATLVRYDSHGRRLWASQFSEFNISASKVFIGPDEMVYTIGGSHAGIWAMSHEAGGAQRWFSRYRPPLGESPYPGHCELDREGNIVIASSFTFDGERDLVVLSYAPDGQLRWEHCIRMDGDDNAGPIAVDAGGNVFVTGKHFAYLNGSPSSVCGLTKLNAAGDQLWHFRGTATGPRMEVAIARGSAFFACESWPMEKTDLLRIDSTGLVQQELTFEGRLGALVGLPDGELYLATRPEIGDSGLGSKLLLVRLAVSGTEFLRGDCNADGRVAGSVTDAVHLLWYLFSEQEEPACLAACDADGDGQLSVTDAIRVLGFNYLGGTPPVDPFPNCGLGSLLPLGCGDQSGCVSR